MGDNRLQDRNYQYLLRSHILLTVLIGLSIIGSFIWFIILDHDKNIAEEENRLRTLGLAASSRTESLLGNVEVTVELLDGWISSNPDKDPRFDPEFYRLVAIFREYSHNKIDIRLVSEDGGLFYLPTTSRVPIVDVSDREYYRAQKNADIKGFYFAAPVKSRVSDTRGIPISYRVSPNAGGVFLILAVLRNSVFEDLYQDILNAPDRSVSILRSDGMVLARTPLNEAMLGRMFPKKPNRVGDISRADAYLPEKTRRTVYSYESADFPLVVTVAQSTVRELARWYRLFAGRFALFCCAFALFLFLSFRHLRLIRENGEFQARLSLSARQDSLTGVMTRGYFLERFEEEIARSVRQRLSCTLLLIDIDHFKQVNDRYGHPVGDQVLVKLTRLMQDSIRSSDICGRMGGEEFAVLLTDTPKDEAVSVAERIRAASREISHEKWEGGVSVGVAELRAPEETLDQLYKRADDALYEAKRTGRNRVCVSSLDQA